MSFELIDVTADNVEETGFFCLMSRRKSAGYQKKREWLRTRFSEGMRIKMFRLPERGFIEYIPGKYAWRAVDAEGYIFIHCLWIVGRSKGRGLGGVLLEECIRESERAGASGVAMITSEKNWLAGKKLLLKHGFEAADSFPPAFDLMVKKFKDTPSPAFPPDIEERAKTFGEGLTVIHSYQCPYNVDAVDKVKEAASKRGIPFRTVELLSSEDVRRLAPSPYGTFSIVYDGVLLSYHYLLPKELERKLDDFAGTRK